MKLSDASQPPCTSTSGEVHHVYMYITCPDAGTSLGLLNIAIVFSVCICVCIVFVFVCVCVSWVCVCVCVCVCVSWVCASVYPVLYIVSFFKIVLFLFS